MEGNSKKSSPMKGKKDDLYHVIHKVPSGDTPYVRAKHAQLVDKDPVTALVLFWAAINVGDRVESALKDMAVVMKQLNRTEEAIEAINSFRRFCSKQAQDSLDNVLIDLYKKCGRIDKQIDLLKRKLRAIYQERHSMEDLPRLPVPMAKKFKVSVKQETSRLLGNLGWAYMQKSNFMMAEVVYRKAQMIDPDANKGCNLVLCLIKQGRYADADSILDDMLQGRIPGCDNNKAQKRARELKLEIQSRDSFPTALDLLGLDDDFVKGLEQLMDERGPIRSKRLPIFEEITPCRDQLAC